MIQSYEDLKVYERAHKLAMDIFWKSREFPSRRKVFTHVTDCQVITIN